MPLNPIISTIYIIVIVSLHASVRYGVILLQMRDVKGAVKGHGTGSLELRFAKLYCEKERITELRSTERYSAPATHWLDARGFRSQEEAPSEWNGGGFHVLDKGSSPPNNQIETQCKNAFRTAHDNGLLPMEWQDLSRSGDGVRYALYITCCLMLATNHSHRLADDDR